MTASCSIEGCGKRHKAHGWCDTHYRRWKLHGDPLVTLARVIGVSAPAEQRFWSFVNKTPGCWLWTGKPSRKGYGRIWNGQDYEPAHRYAYQLLVGPIPDGLTLDHVKANGCTSRACVKAIADEFGPAHLEPVTIRENLLRGDTFQARNAAKTHCPKGHPYDEANTSWSKSRRGTGYLERDCRTCRRARGRRYYHAQRRRATESKV